MKKNTLNSYDAGPKQASMCVETLRTSYKPKENFFAKGKAKYPSIPKGGSRNSYA